MPVRVVHGQRDAPSGEVLFRDLPYPPGPVQLRASVGGIRSAPVLERGIERVQAGHAVADAFEVADFGAAGPGFDRRRRFKRPPLARLVLADRNLVVGAVLAAGVAHVLHPAGEFRAAPCGNAWLRRSPPHPPEGECGLAS
ncbi:MAG: hypothetical protein OXI87_03585 [Albidovulum sp.]|nr:hypothetical protein [Albidovulum sp.]MDE0532465.1 hypothetical protein [Albidovulum sp.]